MKMTLPKFPKFFARKKKKKLRLSTARRASASGAEFEEMSEPNMKLSRALLIVLLLHVVAVGGIIAFNAIKSRQAVETMAPVRTAKSQAFPSAIPREEIKRSPAPKAEPRSTPEGTKFYTVLKGDTPVTIAKKFKVLYDDLLTANHIDDPRKLKIGQKLIIPVKATKAKKGGE
jgi:LysM repeat protein